MHRQHAMRLANQFARWLGREPQKWLRPFVPGAGKPLHRLRGLYADQIKRETEQAMLARMAVAFCGWCASARIIGSFPKLFL